MNLVVDGKVVRTAAGPNTKPGGSERLEPGGWDVADSPGRRLGSNRGQRTGGWGHINVDQIVQTDSTARNTPRRVPRNHARTDTCICP